MKSPAPLRYTCDIRTLRITDTVTGEIIQCQSTFEMAQRRRDLELKAMPPKVERRKRVKEVW